MPGAMWPWLCHQGCGDAGGHVAVEVPPQGWQCQGTRSCGHATISVAMLGHTWPLPNPVQVTRRDPAILPPWVPPTQHQQSLATSCPHITAQLTAPVPLAITHPSPITRRPPDRGGLHHPSLPIAPTPSPITHLPPLAPNPPPTSSQTISHIHCPPPITLNPPFPTHRPPPSPPPQHPSPAP